MLGKRQGEAEQRGENKVAFGSWEMGVVIGKSGWDRIYPMFG